MARKKTQHSQKPGKQDIGESSNCVSGSKPHPKTGKNCLKHLFKKMTSN